MVKQLKRLGIYLVEWHMLRIYAVIMTGAFLSIWIPTMVSVIYQMLKIYGVI